MSGQLLVRIAKGLLRWTVGIVLALCLAVLLFIGIGPRVFHYRVLTVLTGSMRPYASPGDLIVDRPVDLSHLRVGDVFTYEIPVGNHDVISHRIIEIRHPGPHPTIRTKGDANTAPDPWHATLNDGPGWRTRFVVPHLGTIVRFMRGSTVHAVSTRVFPAALAALWLLAIWRPQRGAHWRPSGAPT